MLVYLHEVISLRILHCTGTKIDGHDGVSPRVPINVRCSTFNDILPIQDKWVFYLKGDHWLV